MIKNVVLDMGNVLLDFNPEFVLNTFCSSDEEKEIINKELFNGPEWKLGDKGDIKDKDRFDLVKARVPEKYHAALKNCADKWGICMVPLDGAKVFVSSDYLMLKPDVEIYKTFLDKYELNADECLFVDDREDNIEGAQKAGMNTFRFMGDYESVLKHILKN